MRRGQWTLLPDSTDTTLSHADFVFLDGAVVPTSVVRDVGGPAEDFFIMMVDVDLPLRLRKSGVVMQRLGVEYPTHRLGAAAGSKWRAYYQTRNHLRMAIRHRSAELALGFVIRSGKHLVHGFLHRDWETLGYRLRGCRDGVLGKMGRTVEPT